MGFVDGGGSIAIVTAIPPIFYSKDLEEAKTKEQALLW